MSKNGVSDELAKKLDALAAHFEAACHVGDAYMVEENAADAKTLRDAAAALRSKPVAGVEAKPFMYGVREADGSPYFEELCVSAYSEELQDAAHDIGGEVVALYASPQPTAVITDEMVERAAKAMSKEWGSKSNYFDVLARAALEAALKES